MKNEKQMRGHCQCCGNQQAVRSGHMVHHGYEVARWGFFNGTCRGLNYAPIEESREELDRVNAIFRDEANADCEYASRLAAGSVDPEFIIVSRRERNPANNRSEEVKYQVPFCYGAEWEQDERRRSMVWALESGAKQKRDFCDMMEKLADKMNGKPLMIVAKKEPPAPLADKVMGPRGIMTMQYVQSGRVYWKDARGYSSWMGTQSWRKMPKAEG